MARTIRFQYAGTPTTRPAASEVALRVKAATTLAPSRRSLRNLDTVVLRGRLLGGPVPAAGKVVTVQARTRRGWLTFGTARARAPRWPLELPVHIYRDVDDRPLPLQGRGAAGRGISVHDWHLARGERARPRLRVKTQHKGGEQPSSPR